MPVCITCLGNSFFVGLGRLESTLQVTVRTPPIRQASSTWFDPGLQGMHAHQLMSLAESKQLTMMVSKFITTLVLRV